MLLGYALESSSDMADCTPARPFSRNPIEKQISLAVYAKS